MWCSLFKDSTLLGATTELGVGFSGSLLSVPVIMPGHFVARCIENNIQITVFLPVPCAWCFQLADFQCYPTGASLRLLYSGVRSTQLFSPSRHSLVQLLPRVGMALRGHCADLQFSHEIFIDANG